MPLKISLKPGERIIVGGGVIRNDAAPARLVIENRVPVLRAKDILTADEARTPARKLYFLIQLMYVDEENLTAHYTAYWPLAHEVARKVEGAEPVVEQVNGHLFNREYYRALKCAARLIELER